MLNIQPIRLLKGQHNDTGKTGQGCFMNVVAYLNGDVDITDYSPCVCRVIRVVAITLNDCSYDPERQALLPFIGRAMVSGSADKTELLKRISNLIDMTRSIIANTRLIYAVTGENLDKATKMFNRLGDNSLGQYRWNDECNEIADLCISSIGFTVTIGTWVETKFIKNLLFKFLDDNLPHVSDDVDPVVVQRTNKLIKNAQEVRV